MMERKTNLTKEEMEQVKQNVIRVVDFNISHDEMLPYMCNHVDEYGNDKVQLVNDNAYCPICNIKWDTTLATEEQLKFAVNALVNEIQNLIYMDADMDRSTTEVLAETICVLKRIPDYRKQVMNRLDMDIKQSSFTNDFNSFTPYPYYGAKPYNNQTNPFTSYSNTMNPSVDSYLGKCDMRNYTLPDPFGFNKPGK